MSRTSQLSWGGTVRVVLAAGHGNASPGDLRRLAAALADGAAREALLNVADEDAHFYDTLLLLSAHFLPDHLPISQTELDSYVEGGRTILRYIRQRLAKLRPDSEISLSQWALGVESLEKGVGSIGRPDVLSLSAQLKAAALPEGMRAALAEAPNAAATPAAQLRLRPLLLGSQTPSAQGEFAEQMAVVMEEEGIADALCDAVLRDPHFTGFASLRQEEQLSELMTLSAILKLKLWKSCPDETTQKMTGIVNDVIQGASPEIPTVAAQDAGDKEQKTKEIITVQLVNIIVHGLFKSYKEAFELDHKDDVDTVGESLCGALEMWVSRLVSSPRELGLGWVVELVELWLGALNPVPSAQTLRVLLAACAAFLRCGAGSVRFEDEETPAPPSASLSEDGTILGTWLEELLASVPQLADHPGAASPRRSQSTEAAFRTAPVPARRLAELCGALLETLLRSGLPVRRLPPAQRRRLGQAWGEEQIAALGALWLDLEVRGGAYAGTLAQLPGAVLASAVFGDEDEDALLHCLTDARRLALPNSVLSFLCQLLLRRAEQGHTRLTAQLMAQLIGTLAEAATAATEDEYLSVQQAQVFALLFHSMTQEERVLARDLLINTVKDLRPKHGNPHVVHLLLLLDYMTHQFDEPSNLLVTHVRCNVLKNERGEEASWIPLGRIHGFLRAQAPELGKDALMFDLRCGVCEEELARSPEASAAVSGLVDGLGEATTALEWASDWAASLLACRLLGQPTQGNEDAALLSRPFFRLQTLFFRIRSLGQSLTSQQSDDEKVEAAKALVELISRLGSAQREVVTAELEKVGKGSGIWEIWLGIGGQSATCMPPEMTQLAQDFTTTAPQCLHVIHEALEKADLGEEDCDSFPELLETCMGRNWAPPPRLPLIQILADLAVSALLKAPAPTMLQPSTLQPRTLTHILSRAQLNSSQVADVLSPLAAHIGAARTSEKLVQVIQCLLGPDPETTSARLSSEWATRSLGVLGWAVAKEETSSRALVDALRLYLARQPSAPLSPVALDGLGSRLLGLWARPDRAGSGVGSPEMRDLIQSLLGGPDSALLGELSGLVCQPSLILHWRSDAAKFWDFAQALLGFLRANHVSWREEVIGVMLASIPWDSVGDPAAVDLVRSERWGFAELRPLSAATTLSDFHSWIRLGVQLALLDGGLALRALGKRAVEWLRRSRDSLCSEQSLCVVRGEECPEEAARQTGLWWDAGVSVLALVGELMDAARDGHQRDDEDLDDEEEEEIVATPRSALPATTASPPDSSQLLCTFTRTAKDFETQHWYHCHTCGMVAGEGVCTVCAKVCHADHDLSYAKYGSFFCDCGAKGEGACLALRRRSPQPLIAHPQPVPAQSAVLRRSVKPLLRSVGLKSSAVSGEAKAALRQSLSESGAKDICESILGLLSYVGPAVSRGAELSSGSGSVQRRRSQPLPSPLPPTSMSRALVTREAQSRAVGLEKLGAAVSGEQSSSLRQLLSSNVLRRNPITVLTPPAAAQEYIALSQDKNRILILPAVHFYNQLRQNSKKINLARSGYETVNMTVVSMVGRGGRLAVCGLREITILIVSASGAVSEKINLPIQLQTPNFIIKATWLSEREVCVVTADFVNIYDLEADNREQAKHQFLLPVGKVRDVTLVSSVSASGEPRRWVGVGSSTGSVFLQELLPSTELAEQGAFYLTEAVELGLEGSAELVSLHFSPPTARLFAAFADGLCVVADMAEPGLTVPSQTQLRLQRTSGSGPEALVGWAEIASTPGLFLALAQDSRNPFLIYLCPETTHVQALEVESGTLLGCVLLGGGDDADVPLSLVTLGEEGELELWGESQREPLDGWRMPSPGWRVGVVTPSASRTSAAVSAPPAALPIEFFESCLPLSQIKFTGKDLLQIYSKTQLKSRLLSNSLHVACPKPGGFELEIENEDPETVICGLRVEIGKQGMDRAPKFIQVFGRQKQISLNRHRWIDIPFSRNETISCSGKVKVKFGGGDGGGGPVTVDGVKVYGKSRDAFGWEADADGGGAEDGVVELRVPLPPLPQLLLAQAFNSLGLYFRAFPNGSDRPASSLDLATAALVANVHPATLQAPKALLSRLFSSAKDRCLHADTFVLSFVWRSVERAEAQRDPELLAFLLHLLRDIAVHRPHNLHHALTASSVPLSVASSPAKDMLQGTGKAKRPLIPSIVELFWSLTGISEAPEELLTLQQNRLREIRSTTWAIMELVFGYCRVEPTFVSEAGPIIFRFLTSRNVRIAQTARAALQSLLSPRSSESMETVRSPKDDAWEAQAPPPPLSPPPVPSSPLLFMDADEVDAGEDELDAVGVELLDVAEMEEQADADEDDLEELMAAAAGGEDETAMLELAVALSLQQEEADQQAPPVPPAPPLPPPQQGPGGGEEFDESGLMSDTSGPLSEDEGSSAQPSARAASPKSPEKNGGTHVEKGSKTVHSSSSSERNLSDAKSGSEELEGLASLDSLGAALLESFSAQIPQLRERGLSGPEAVAFLQSVLLLLSHPQLPSEESFLQPIISRILGSIDFVTTEAEPEILCRSRDGEVTLLKLRLVSVLLSRAKSSRGSKRHSGEEAAARLAAEGLQSAGAVPFCLRVLRRLYETWIKDAKDEARFGLRAEESPESLPDLSPFFQPQYVREFSRDLFVGYHQLLSEMVLRLPYQMKKILGRGSEGSGGALMESPEWTDVLCDLVSCQEVAFVRRQARKLLLLIAGNKESYRVLRDLYILTKRLGAVRELSGGPGDGDASPLALAYHPRSQILEHLKAAADVAKGRARNWQNFLHTAGYAQLDFLLWLGSSADEIVGKAVMGLLLDALVSLDPLIPPSASSKASSNKRSLSKIKAESKSKRKGNEGGGSEETMPASESGGAFSQELGRGLAEALLAKGRRAAFLSFLRRSLILSKISERRWQAHRLVRALFRLCGSAEKEEILAILWTDMWGEAESLGRRLSLLSDLLVYFTVQLSPSERVESLASQLLDSFSLGVDRLQSHPNASLYRALGQHIQVDGYYLEANPCWICDDPELPFQSMKLSAIKSDARWTTTTQMVALNASYEISRLTLKLTDVKRQKMIKTLRLHSSNKRFASAVELKSRESDWERIREVEVAPGQTEIRVELAVPVLASALVLDVAAFHDSAAPPSELLHCPRCSASVTPNPGMCSNCGENVYQCHKCRSINYDEKDPFMCNSCGFSKYAKMEVTVSARVGSPVEAITSVEGRARATAAIGEALERAEEWESELRGFRAQLEAAARQAHEHRAGAATTDAVADASELRAPPATILPHIHQLAQKYNGDCRKSFLGLRRASQELDAQRAELMEFDRRCGLPPHPRLSARQTPPSADCYGCQEGHLLLLAGLLKALLASLPAPASLAAPDLLSQLRSLLSQAPLSLQAPLRELIVTLCRDNVEGTARICDDIEKNVAFYLSCGSVTDTESDIALLRSTLTLNDSAWQRRLQCVSRALLMSVSKKSGGGREKIVLPCLQMLQSALVPTDGTTTAAAPAKPQDISLWLKGDAAVSDPAAKFGRRWLAKVGRGSVAPSLGWLSSALFCEQSLSLRMATAGLIRQLARDSPTRRAAVLDASVAYVERIGELGLLGAELVELVQGLSEESEWRCYLGVRGLVPRLGHLLEAEVGRLVAAEEAGAPSNCGGGFPLGVIASLLGRLLQVPGIRRRWKAEMVGPVLEGYLSLRLLLSQRTRLVQEAQDRLLTLLEDLTSGTEAERRAFAATCVATLRRYPLTDTRTPLFIFERLCDIIHSEKSEVGEFKLKIEKDPAQEDFLQGRMVGNPYSSAAPGLGPLMKDVKNKICRDCELIALLDDDNGMELLVDGKIVSLELEVGDVYRKLWLPKHPDQAVMPVVYRMRGLLGDATEEFISAFDANQGEKEDEEDEYQMAQVMGECGGLEILFARLESLPSLPKACELLKVLLKLLGFCLKVRRNRELCIVPSLRAIPILVEKLHGSLAGGGKEGQAAATDILHLILVLMAEGGRPEAIQAQPDFFRSFGTSSTEIEWIVALLGREGLGEDLRDSLSKALPFFAAASEDATDALIRHFAPVLNLIEFDTNASSDQTKELENFCLLAKGIPNTEDGGRLKSAFNREISVVSNLIDYLRILCPPLFKVGLTIESVEWKEYLSRKGLKYALRILAGFCSGHGESQELVANSADCIMSVHRLEQLSTEERLGSLAENLMESLAGNAAVAKKIDAVRRETKKRRKEMAMAVREMHLREVGMEAKGGTLMPTRKLAAADAPPEESGLVCSVCRDGYSAQPNKLLAVYTYSSRQPSDPGEVPVSGAAATLAYSTVSHFNVIHVDCHLSAVRSARGREEWESAALHNANTKANGLLPLWGPDVAETNFAACLARHNAYVQEATHIGEISVRSGVDDLKLLLRRFADETSFSAESGGGGAESNVQLIPSLLLLPLYLMNQARLGAAQEKLIRAFLAAPPSSWVPSSFVADGSLYWVVAAPLLLSPKAWAAERLTFLRRLIVLAQSRAVHGTAGQAPLGNLPDKEPRDWAAFKGPLRVFGLVDAIYTILLKGVSEGEDSGWGARLQTHLRVEEGAVREAAKALLAHFERAIRPIASLDAFLLFIGESAIQTDTQAKKFVADCLELVT